MFTEILLLRELQDNEKPPRKCEAVFFVLALPIFPASHPASIVGADELNFRVRNGNGCTLHVDNTNHWCTFRDSNPGPTD